MIARLEDYSGINLAAAFTNPEVSTEFKWHCKYVRQNGIHVSPTFMIDGLVAANVGSGDPIAKWVEAVQ